MKPGGGKQKGASFERTVCKSLSLWVSGRKRDDIFWRSAMSGGRATLGFRKGLDRSAQAGDVSAIDPIGHTFLDTFLVECKFYKDLNIGQFVLGTGGKLFTFWNKLLHDAKDQNKVPMLIAKQNRSPIFVVVPLTTTSPTGYLDRQCVTPDELVVAFALLLDNTKPTELCAHYKSCRNENRILGVLYK